MAPHVGRLATTCPGRAAAFTPLPARSTPPGVSRRASPTSNRSDEPWRLRSADERPDAAARTGACVRTRSVAEHPRADDHRVPRPSAADRAAPPTGSGPAPAHPPRRRCSTPCGNAMPEPAGAAQAVAGDVARGVAVVRRSSARRTPLADGRRRPLSHPRDAGRSGGAGAVPGGVRPRGGGRPGDRRQRRIRQDDGAADRGAGRGRRCQPRRTSSLYVIDCASRSLVSAARPSARVPASPRATTSSRSPG